MIQTRKWQNRLISEEDQQVNQMILLENMPMTRQHVHRTAQRQDAPA